MLESMWESDQLAEQRSSKCESDHHQFLTLTDISVYEWIALFLDCHYIPQLCFLF